MTDANEIARSRGKAALRDVIDKGAQSRPPAFSDEAIAVRFAQRHAGEWRFVAAWGKWLSYDGMRWRIDETLEVFHLIRRTCCETASECRGKGLAKSIASGGTVAAVERLARSDRRLAATAEQWDQDLWVLNTPGGVVDLKTGTVRSHRPEDYMTKLAGTAPDPACRIMTWLEFLDRVCGQSSELITFLQRMSGYGLTGSTIEHALFFLFGTGANGKSTFVNALTSALGDYHKTSPIETFTASNSDRHPTDLATLRGARLVTSVETEEGRRWAESKIKSLTGGDRISARFMRQDFFEFTPTFKLVVAGNHKPGLRSVDEAIRRRFHLVPFTVTIPVDERDEGLGEKLRAELPGILAWAIQGCLDWQASGLMPPPVVRDATANYLEAEDALAAWIEDAGERESDVFEASQALYRSWKSWCDRTGEHAGSLKKFSQRLEDRGASIGIQKGRDANGRRGFYGLRVTKPDLVTEAGEA